MKKFLFLTLLTALAASAAWAQSTLQLAGDTYRIDTLRHQHVGPGTEAYQVSLSGARNLRYAYVVADLQHPQLQVRALTGDEHAFRRATVSEMAQGHSSDSLLCFAGVNADFFYFSDNSSLGARISDGEIACTSREQDWEHFYVLADGTVGMADATLIRSTLWCGDRACDEGRVNDYMGDDRLVLYNNCFGAQTPAWEGGVTEVVARVAGGGWLPVDQTIEMEILSDAQSTQGGTAIPQGCLVLSASGCLRSTLQGMKQGDVVRVTTSVEMDARRQPGVRYLVGGRPMLLSEGKPCDTERVLDHLVARHPRTAVGLSQDRRHLVLMVVDGRSELSAGVTSRELTELLSHVGCHTAMNLDGGGSSVLYIHGDGAWNKPSDGTERPVSNGIFLCAKRTE